ncbi:cell wall-binding repeat-containing protein [Herbiconiux sp. 11R-BC]|uniref:cell wall-binding repeat-containing protein n=1 Tax=Herbiconiux sp. 11R-BC TaxID=3111637 RepID=UPI003C0964B9
MPRSDDRHRMLITRLARGCTAAALGLALAAAALVPVAANAAPGPSAPGRVSAPVADAGRAGVATGPTDPDAATPAPSPAGDLATPDPDPASPSRMGSYPAEAYAAAAAALPDDLAAAIQADLGKTPADYLAGADAAADGVAVVDGLTASGVDVLGSRLDGTALVVNVATAADAAPVKAANAVAEIGEPAALDVSAHTFRPLGDLVGGQGYYSKSGTGSSIYLCSVAFNGYDIATKANQFLTAGHCRVSGTLDSGRVYESKQSAPGLTPIQAGPVLGQPIDSTVHFGDELDYGLVATDPAWSAVPRVGTWNSNAGPVTAGTQQVLRDYTQAIVGQSICKSGRTTGWTCGTVQAVDELVDVEDHSGQGVQVNSVISSMCALPGDSGGAVLSGAYAIGLLSAGDFASSCSESGKFTAAFPLVSAPGSGYGSVLGAQPGWEPAVSVSAPTVSQPSSGGTLALGAAFTGTAPDAGGHFTVRVTIDGSSVFTASVASDHTWSADVFGLASGQHSYSVVTVFGSGTSVSTPVTGTFTLTAPTTTRIAGADRFEVAVNVAAQEFPGSATAPVVYIATGANYPDALSAGPAATVQGGPLLLVTRDAVPASVASTIQRLAPTAPAAPLRIVIVGGVNSVSEAVAAQLGALVPGASVERLAGDDRYAASRAVVASAFPSAPSAYAATGANFPDALSAGGAAGSAARPVLLVNGGADSADAATIGLFRNLSTTSITVVGGVNSVHAGVLQSLTTVPASVTRIDGADRFAASINLNHAAFTQASKAYLATGYNFPDALSGGVLAGMTDAPLFVVPTECVPRGVLREFARLGTMQVTLLGGPNSLSAAVANLTPCGF